MADLGIITRVSTLLFFLAIVPLASEAQPSSTYEQQPVAFSYESYPSSEPAACMRYDTDRNGCIDATGDAGLVVTQLSIMSYDPTYQVDIERFDVSENGIVSASDANYIQNCVGRALGNVRSSGNPDEMDCTPCLCDYLTQEPPSCMRYDTDRNGCVDATGDAGAVVAEISKQAENPQYQTDIDRYDITQNGSVSPLDSLRIINCVGRAVNGGQLAGNEMDCKPCLCDYLE